jgi:hypothetical protein
VCTIAVAVAADRRWPLVAAANRDERMGRPSEGWALRDLPGGARAAAPRDAVQGGTWIGVSETGLFAAITNYHPPDEGYPDRSRRSRGELVNRALAARSLEDARAAAEAADPHGYNPFHLVVIAGSRGFVWRYDGERAALEEVGPGLTVVTERDPRGRCSRGDWVRAHWPLDLSPPRLRELLAGHGEPPWNYPCIHLGAIYGTRSGCILRLGQDLDRSELYVADGSPCAALFEDRSDLLATLGGGETPSARGGSSA